MRPLILALPLLTACAELDQFLPQVSFQRMEVAHIDFREIEADFVFAVDNPNPISVGLSSFSWDFDLAGSDLLSGDRPDGFELGASGRSELALPVQLGWQDAWETAQATRGLDIVAFGLSGHFGFDTPLGEARLPYSEDGDFPALRTPKFGIQRLRVGSVNLLTQSADLSLDLSVDNAHGSTLFFDAIQYDITLGGVAVAGGSMPHLGEVAGDTEGTLTIPLTVNLLQAGATITTAIVNRDPLPVRLEAMVDVDTPWGVLPLDVSEIADAILQ